MIIDAWLLMHDYWCMTIDAWLLMHDYWCLMLDLNVIRWISIRWMWLLMSVTVDECDCWWVWLLVSVTVGECDCWWMWLLVNVTVDEYDCCSMTINKYWCLLCKTINKKPYKELLSLRKLRKKSDKILILKQILLYVM